MVSRQYVIYRSHLGDATDAEAERYRLAVEQALGIPAVLLHRVQGVGSGLRGSDDEAETERAHQIAQDIWDQQRF